MNRIVKTTVLCAAVAATALAAVPAGAHGRHHRHHGGDAVAAGVLGLAAGAILGGALAQRPAPRRIYRYDAPPPPPAYRYRRPPLVYEGRAYAPWTPAWYRACDARYRTFDPESGTFMGYDGVRHFCRP